MPYTLDELIRPLGPRLETVRPLTVLSPLSGVRPTPDGFIRKYGLLSLAAGLSLAVAGMWSMQSGYLMVTQQHQPAQTIPANPAPNACTDPTRGELPAKATSLRELQESVIPEIRAGYPPQMSKPEIIRLPPDMSSVAATPVPRPQSTPVPVARPVAKNKPAAKDVRP